MEVLRSLPNDRLRSGAVAFGNFDGVHLGHRALVDSLRSSARERGQEVTVLTFYPHPLALLRPERSPAAVDTLEGRLLWLERLGVDRVIVLPFDERLRTQSARWFASEVIFGLLQASVCVVGPGARFGRGGEGDIALLRQLGEQTGARVSSCLPTLYAGEVVSSSRVRRAVVAGELALAEALLARPFCLRGSVVRGDGLGRTLGFPTANIGLSTQVLPPPGVYVGHLEMASGMLEAVINIGHRPTVGGTDLRVEAHALNWAGDLYGQSVSLHLYAALRQEQRFLSTSALCEAIEVDIAQAQGLLQGRRARSAGPTS